MHSTEPVNRIMSSRVFSVSPVDSVGTVLRLFAQMPIHHLPVVENGRVVGMVSAADVSRFQFQLPSEGSRRGTQLADVLAVQRVMRSPVLTIPEHESAMRAAEIMQSSGVHSLPVVDSSGKLIGIITTTDIIRRFWQGDGAVANHLAFEMDATHSPRDATTKKAALEDVYRLAKRYLNAGQDERLHVELQRAIERADEANNSRNTHEVLGLSFS